MTGDLRSTDRGVVRRAQRGDTGAFEELYRSTVGRVYALCLRMTGDPSLAEELTQESYLRAWRKLAGFRGDSAFSSWLHQVAVNVVLSHYRGRSRRREQTAQLGDLPVADTSVAPGSQADAVDLERAIAQLPQRARTVFVLHDVEGYKHNEIAKLAGMAIGTSKAQLSRARRLLREALTS